MAVNVGFGSKLDFAHSKVVCLSSSQAERGGDPVSGYSPQAQILTIKVSTRVTSTMAVSSHCTWFFKSHCCHVGLGHPRVSTEERMGTRLCPWSGRTPRQSRRSSQPKARRCHQSMLQPSDLSFFTQRSFHCTEPK